MAWIKAKYTACGFIFESSLKMPDYLLIYSDTFVIIYLDMDSSAKSRFMSVRTMFLDK